MFNWNNKLIKRQSVTLTECLNQNNMLFAKYVKFMPMSAIVFAVGAPRSDVCRQRADGQLKSDAPSFPTRVCSRPTVVGAQWALCTNNDAISYESLKVALATVSVAKSKI